MGGLGGVSESESESVNMKGREADFLKGHTKKLTCFLSSLNCQTSSEVTESHSLVSM